MINTIKIQPIPQLIDTRITPSLNPSYSTISNRITVPVLLRVVAIRKSYKKYNTILLIGKITTVQIHCTCTIVLLKQKYLNHKNKKTIPVKAQIINKNSNKA